MWGVVTCTVMKYKAPGEEKRIELHITSSQSCEGLDGETFC